MQISNNKPYILSDLTNNRDELINRINNIKTDKLNEDEHKETFLNQLTGLTNLFKSPGQSKVMVFITDGKGRSLSDSIEKEIITKCKSNSILFVAMIINSIDSQKGGMYASLNRIASATKGKVFTGLKDEAEIEKIVLPLLNTIQFKADCVIEWESADCNPDRTIEITYKPLSFVKSYNYQEPKPSIAMTRNTLTFVNTKPGEIVEQSFRIEPGSIVFQIDTIRQISGSNSFTIISPAKFPITLKKESSTEIIVRFTPSDSSYTEAKFAIEPLCHSNTFLVKAEPVKQPETKLRLEFPNGGDTLLADRDVLIKWVGETNKFYKIDYSDNGGMSWINIAKYVNALQYLWEVPDTINSNSKIRVSVDTSSDALVSRFYNSNVEFSNSNSLNRIWHISWSPDDSKFIAVNNLSDQLNDAVIWDVQSQKEICILKGHTSGINRSAWSSDGSKVLTTSIDRTVRVWDAASGKQLNSLLHNSSIFNAYWLSGNQRVLTSVGSKAYIWDISTGKASASFSNYESENILQSVTISPDKTKIAMYSDNKKLIVWDSETLKEIISFNERAPRYTSWSPDGSKIISCSDSLRIWDIHKGTLELSLPKWGDGSSITKADWSYDGKYILYFNQSSNIIRVCNSSTGELLHEITFPNSPNIVNAEWSPTKHIISAACGNTSGLGNEEGGYALWDLNNPDVKTSNQTATVVTTAWSNNGEKVAFGGMSGIVNILGGTLDSLVNSDQSDGVFSIRKQEFSVLLLDIDMQQGLLASNRDTLVRDFLVNNGNNELHIDSIVVRGTDKENFKMISNFTPFKIQPKASRTMEFNFNPKIIGNIEAEVWIFSFKDSLKATIKGVGVNPVLESSTGLLNYGVLSVGKELPATLSIKNINDKPIEITKIYNGGPNTKDFYLQEGIPLPILLQPNSSLEASVKFKPSVFGRTSGRIVIEYNGMIKPMVVDLYGSSSDSVAVSVENDDISGMEFGFIVPNPAENYVELDVNIENESNIDIMLCDQTGRSVRNYPEINVIGGKQKLQLDLQGISSGAYFLMIKTNTSQRTIPLQVIK